MIGALVAMSAACTLVCAYIAMRLGYRRGFKAGRDALFTPVFERRKQMPMGFDSINDVQPACVVKLHQEVQENCRNYKPERIVIPEHLGEHFVVKAFLVDGVNQFVSAGDLPAATFSETAFGVRLQCDMGRKLTLIVANHSDTPQRFLACVIGSMTETPRQTSKKQKWRDKVFRRKVVARP
jgi:hypothetical protein